MAPQDEAATPEDESVTTLSIQPLTVRGFQAEKRELSLRVGRAPGGPGLVTSSTLDGETVTSTWAGVVQIIIPGTEGGANVPVEGGGIWSFSDQRVFGLLTHGKALGGRVGIDQRGNGEVVVFAISVDMVDEVEERRGMFGKLRAVTLLGSMCGMVLDVVSMVQPDGSFGRGRNDDLLPIAERFAAQTVDPSLTEALRDETR